MSKMKKFMSLLLAAVMVLSVMTVNVFAEETGDGSITITDAKKEETYSLYRIFALTLGGEYEEDDETKYGTYSYQVTDAWRGFFAKGKPGANYIELDNHGYIASSENLTASNAAAFAELAAIYAESLSEADAEQTISADGALEFDNLPLGYYLIHSTYGSSGICALKSTDKEVEVTEKNMQPILTKEVYEDSTKAWGKVNDAEYGEEVDFKITITVEENASDYILTDKLPDDMTLVAGTIVVDGANAAPVVDADKKGFSINFGDMDEAKAGDVITVTYKATVDAGADVDEALVNTATLTYDDTNADGQGDVEMKATTETYTWDISVKKVNNAGTALAGAKFVLKNAEGGYYKFVDGDDKIRWVEKNEEPTVFESPANGEFVIKGLDSGIYYLEETEAPEGYNMLTSDVEIEVDGVSKAETDTVANIGALYVTIGDEETTVGKINDKITVVNNTGAELPETGGIGTMIFRVGGAALIIAAGALLIAKKRTNNI